MAKTLFWYFDVDLIIGENRVGLFDHFSSIIMSHCFTISIDLWLKGVLQSLILFNWFSGGIQKQSIPKQQIEVLMNFPSLSLFNHEHRVQFLIVQVHVVDASECQHENIHIDLGDSMLLEVEVAVVKKLLLRDCQGVHLRTVAGIAKFLQNHH